MCTKITEGNEEEMEEEVKSIEEEGGERQVVVVVVVVVIGWKPLRNVEVVSLWCQTVQSVHPSPHPYSFTLSPLHPITPITLSLYFHPCKRYHVILFTFCRITH